MLWSQFWDGDWLSDAQLTLCGDATRGVWADWTAHMRKEGVGEVKGTYEQLARLGRTSPKGARGACNELSVTGSALVTSEKVNGVEVVTVVCRRLQRQVKERVATRLRVARHRGNASGNGAATENVTPALRGRDRNRSKIQSTEGGVPPNPPARAPSSESDAEGRGPLAAGAPCAGGGNGSFDPTTCPPEAQIPTVEEVCAAGEKCVPAAAPGAYCRWWHGKMSSDRRWMPRGFLIDWEWELGNWWRRDQGAFQQGRHWACEVSPSGPQNIKNGGLLPWKELQELELAWERHPSNAKSTFHIKNAAAEVVEEGRRMRDRMAELKKFHVEQKGK